MIGGLASFTKSFIEKTKYLSARTQYRACMSKFQHAAMQSSSALGLIMTQALRLVPLIQKDFDGGWHTIEIVNVNFPYKETKNGTMHGAQTFGPWVKKLNPEHYPQNEFYKEQPMDKNDIEMRIVFSGYCDDRWYLNGEMLDNIQYASNEYKEIEPWDENKTLTVDVENYYPPMGDDRLHPHYGRGTIEVQTRIKPGSCTYVNRTDIRKFQYKMSGGGFKYKGTPPATFDCGTIGAMRCQTLPHFTALGGSTGTEVTYPPPEGRKTPPCPKYRPISNFPAPPFPPVDYELSKGARGTWRRVDGGKLCETEISFEFRPDIDIVGGGLTKASCAALFTYDQAADILKYLVDSEFFGENGLRLWRSFTFPDMGYFPKIDALVREYLWKYFDVNIDVEERSWDRVQRVRQQCTCDKLEATRCLTPQEKLAIIAALSAGSCAIAKTMLAGITARIARNPAGALCLAAGLFIFLSADSEDDTDKPPRR